MKKMESRGNREGGLDDTTLLFDLTSTVLGNREAKRGYVGKHGYKGSEAWLRR